MTETEAPWGGYHVHFYDEDKLRAQGFQKMADATAWAEQERPGVGYSVMGGNQKTGSG